MKQPRLPEFLQASICVLCIVVVGREIDFLGQSEFSGGRVSGLLFSLGDTAWFLFIVGLLGSFVLRRAAAALLIVAAVLCLPLYFYSAFPGPARRILGGEYSVSLLASSVWDVWLVAGILSLASLIYVCIRGLRNP